MVDVKIILNTMFLHSEDYLNFEYVRDYLKLSLHNEEGLCTVYNDKKRRMCEINNAVTGMRDQIILIM